MHYNAESVLNKARTWSCVPLVMIYTKKTIKLMYTVYAFGLCIGVNPSFHITGIIYVIFTENLDFCLRRDLNRRKRFNKKLYTCSNQGFQVYVPTGKCQSFNCGISLEWIILDGYSIHNTHQTLYVPTSHFTFDVRYSVTKIIQNKYITVAKSKTKGNNYIGVFII